MTSTIATIRTTVTIAFMAVNDRRDFRAGTYWDGWGSETVGEADGEGGIDAVNALPQKLQKPDSFSFCLPQ